MGLRPNFCVRGVAINCNSTTSIGGCILKGKINQGAIYDRFKQHKKVNNQLENVLFELPNVQCKLMTVF